ncbi:MAG: M1 family peptidase, partial [Pricia sp.]
EQWLLQKGYPELKWDWKYQNGKIRVDIDQRQDHHIFQFPLEIGIVSKGNFQIRTLEIDQKSKTFEIPASAKPDALVLDPELWLLFEEKK